jgi:hypothetical protein
MAHAGPIAVPPAVAVACAPALHPLAAGGSSPAESAMGAAEPADRSAARAGAHRKYGEANVSARRQAVRVRVRVRAEAAGRPRCRRRGRRQDIQCGRDAPGGKDPGHREAPPEAAQSRAPRARASYCVCVQGAAPHELAAAPRQQLLSRTDARIGADRHNRRRACRQLCGIQHRVPVGCDAIDQPQLLHAPLQRSHRNLGEPHHVRGERDARTRQFP